MIACFDHRTASGAFARTSCAISSARAEQLVGRHHLGEESDAMGFLGIDPI